MAKTMNTERELFARKAFWNNKTVIPYSRKAGCIQNWRKIARHPNFLQ